MEYRDKLNKEANETYDELQKELTIEQLHKVNELVNLECQLEGECC